MAPIRTFLGRRGEPSWPSLLVGVAAGVTLGVVLARRAADASGTATPPWSERLGRAWDGAAESLSSAREALSGPVPAPDLEALGGVLEGLEGAEALRVRSLGRGIVELVGTAPSLERVREVTAALSAQPGVSVVVNRVWTPSSAAPDAAR